jgi:iron complex transport system permease protein
VTQTHPAAPDVAPDQLALAAVRRPGRTRATGLIVLLGVLVVVALLSVAFGSRVVGWDAVVEGVRGAFGGAPDGFDQAAVAKRVPRTLLALVAGAGLGLAGAVMQGVTRNPLADPGILGVNMGASLAVVVGMAWFGLSTARGYVWAAILGAAVAAVLVYTIGSLGNGGATPLKLALAGAATSAALASFISAVVLGRNDLGENVQSWQIGGVGGATWSQLGIVWPFLLVGVAVCLLSARGLNLLALGDDLAAGLGQRVALARGMASLGAVVLCGAVTAVTGPIGFVGLVVPHLCRLLVGVDHRWLLPFSALAGAILLTGADVLGRLVARPEEVAVGIITAFIGAPFFVWVVRRQKVRAL